MEKKALYTKVKASVFKRMKLFAVKKDLKIEQIVEAALDKYLAEEERPGAVLEMQQEK
ncbi:hypothetical protein ACFL35_03035 [Candidatus Riflebacteria bacterium]